MWYIDMSSKHVLRLAKFSSVRLKVDRIPHLIILNGLKGSL